MAIWFDRLANFSFPCENITMNKIGSLFIRGSFPTGDRECYPHAHNSTCHPPQREKYIGVG